MADENNTEEKKVTGLGFGFFSTPDTEHNWETASYDGCESLSDMRKKILAGTRDVEY